MLYSNIIMGVVKYSYKSIFYLDYEYIEIIEKEFKDLFSKEKENIKPSEEKELMPGINQHNIIICSLINL